MKQVGVWLDKKKAHIIVLQNGTEKLYTENSELEFFNPKGGSGTKFKGGPQDVVQDSRYLEREDQQLKKYFHSIAEKIIDADELALFGPALTANKLREQLVLSYPDLATKIKTVAKSDSMTQNQLKALIRDYFKSF